MRILFMLARQFNIMLQISELKAMGISSKDIASKLAMQPFIVNKAMKQVDNFREDMLRKALEEAVDTENNIKTGNMDEKMGVEMLLIKYSAKA